MLVLYDTVRMGQEFAIVGLVVLAGVSGLLAALMRRRALWVGMPLFVVLALVAIVLPDEFFSYDVYVMQRGGEGIDVARYYLTGPATWDFANGTTASLDVSQGGECNTVINDTDNGARIEGVVYGRGFAEEAGAAEDVAAYGFLATKSCIDYWGHGDKAPPTEITVDKNFQPYVVRHWLTWDEG